MKRYVPTREGRGDGVFVSDPTALQRQRQQHGDDEIDHEIPFYPRASSAAIFSPSHVFNTYYLGQFSFAIISLSYQRIADISALWFTLFGLLHVRRERYGHVFPLYGALDDVCANVAKYRLIVAIRGKHQLGRSYWSFGRRLGRREWQDVNEVSSHLGPA